MDRLRFKLETNFGDDICCKKCGELNCICNKNNSKVLNRDLYNIWINNQKKNGKDITICGVFYETKEELNIILKEIKKKFASGGCIKETENGYTIEIQGSISDKVKDFLKTKKFKFKK